MPTNTFPTFTSGSMKVSDDIKDNAIAMYPLARAYNIPSRVIQFLGDQEQRWSTNVELFSTILEFHSLNGYDLSVLVDFFRKMKGGCVNPSLTNTFEITLNGVLFKYCCFDQDGFSPISNIGEKFSTSLKIKQIRPN